MTMQFVLKEETFLRKEKSNFLKMQPESDEFFNSMPPDKIYQTSHTTEAVCEAYYGKHVKLKFSDRTIVSLASDRRIASIITKSGDILEIQTLNPGIYHRYVQAAIEYWDYVFKPAKEKIADQIQQETLRYNLDKAIEQNSELLDIIDGNFRFKNEKDRLILPTPVISQRDDSYTLEQSRQSNLILRASDFTPLP